MMITDISKARYNMIEQQIKPWNVFDVRVLSALETVPREQFMPSAYQDMALMDMNIPLPSGSHTFTPKEEARIAQALEIQATDTVLHIGAGCGYLTALLAELSQQVHAVELHEANHALASENLAKLTNVTLEKGCGLVCAQNKQYDVIVCTASVDQCPEQFFEGLNDQGRLFIVEGNAPDMKATVIHKHPVRGIQQQQILFETQCDRLNNLVPKSTFSL